ncbi:L-2-hydroxyglutarate oxidase LhgO [Chromobacterium violaceum]|uniref:L-2-hydroxyglutarate oxidase LhgO n=1 Tax=Chromobacterium violaceum TaxID=536 RepID=A0A447T4U8_CHRVL|nr:L-2-hydroxyglutarate oxidase LhgO [Chromobacterium violaceum]
MAGRDALYRYCAERAIPHRRLGKLIVASRESQLAKLAALEAQARANGVADIRRLTASEARALEPALDCAAALLSPSTGIVDSHALMLSLLADAEAAGAQLALASPVEGGEVTPDGVALRVAGMALLAKRVVNAAGLFAPDVAAPSPACAPTRSAGPLRSRRVFLAAGPRAVLAAGLPAAGSRRPGQPPDAGPRRPSALRPDVEWVDGVDYRVDPAARTPSTARCAPGGRSCRTARSRRLRRHPRQDRRPGEPDADFVIQGPAVHGAPGWSTCSASNRPA